MRNPSKFVSPKLDTPSSRYEFLKLVFKSVKHKKNQYNTVPDRWGPLVSRTHASATPGLGKCSGEPNLTSNDGNTNVFPTTSRVGW